MPTEGHLGYEHILGQIQKLFIEQLEVISGVKRPAKIGIGTPGATEPATGVLENLPTLVFCSIGFHADEVLQLFKLFGVLLAGGVDVLPFGDEPQGVAAVQAVVFENVLEALEVVSVDDEQLVLVELDFHRGPRIQDGDSGAAVVRQQVFEVVQEAFEDREVDLLPVGVDVLAAAGVVARLQDDVHGLAERIEHVHEQLEGTLFGLRGHQDRDGGPGRRVP